MVIKHFADGDRSFPQLNLKWKHISKYSQEYPGVLFSRKHMEYYEYK